MTNIHVGTNKDKILVVLYTSKTHSRAHYPQKIKISSNELQTQTRNVMFFCPFRAIREFITIHGDYETIDENFILFSDKSVPKPVHFRNTLKAILDNLNIDSSLYGTHSFRIGRSCDLFKAGFSVDQIKKLGRWKSNAVYKYLCD